MVVPMITRFFDHNPETGMTEIFHYDNGRVWMETVMDAQPVFDDNQREYNSVDERAKWGEFTKVASVPMHLFTEMRRSGVLKDPKAIAKFLNDRDNLKFRTRPGRL